MLKVLSKRDSQPGMSLAIKYAFMHADSLREHHEEQSGVGEVNAPIQWAAS